jgi:hypothetical protein
VPALQLALASSSVVGGNSVSGTVTIADSAPIVGATVTLQSSYPTATVPSRVIIPSGQTSASFTITTTTVSAARTLTITANYGNGNVKQSATLTVNPQGTPTPTGLAVSPSLVTGGVSATGVVTLGAAAPVGGIVVILQSRAPTAAQVPGSVMIPQGSTTASFTIQTYHVTSTQTVTITATAGGIQQTAILTVQ